MIQSVVVTALGMLVNVVGGIIAARALEVAGRGELAAAILWPAVLCSLVEMGLPTASTYLSASQPETRYDLARTVVPMLTSQSLLVWLVGTPIILVALGGYSPELRATAIGFLLVYAPLYLGARYLSALNQGEGRMGVFNVARLMIPSVYGAMLLALVVLDVVGVRVFAAAYAGTWAVALVALLVMSSSKTRRGMLRPKLDWGQARLSWSIGRRAYFGSLAPVDALQLDVLLTTALLGAQEAGLYFIATSAAAVVRTWGTTFGALSLPRVAGATSRDEGLSVMSLFVRLTVVLSGLSAAVLFAFAGPLLTLVYGEDYAPAATLVRILAVGMLAASLRYVLGDGLRGMGRPSLATRAEMLGWLAGAVALVVLLPLWGVTGVAVAVSLSFITTLSVMLGFVRRLGAHPARMLVPSRSDFSRGTAMLRGTPKGRRS